MSGQLGLRSRPHILSIAVEDYFHGPAFAKLISNNRWGRLDTRIEQNCLSVLEKLEAVNSTATFFATRWIARNHSALLREIARRGHEVALAGARGLSFRLVKPVEFREQLRRDRDAVEQSCHMRVAGFRASDVFLRPEDLWALEILAAEGFQYDSSLSPFLRAFGEEPWRQFIHRNETGQGTIWEVPLSSRKLAGLMIPFAGGNYFRQFPEWLVNNSLRQWTTHHQEPLVLYLRLWDFDPFQPKVRTGSFLQNFRHYRNAERMLETANRLLESARFTSIAANLRLPPSAVERASQRSEALFPPDSTQVPHRPPLIPISVVVPCFNEAAGVGYLAKSLAELKQELASGYDVEFILIDDGSRDETWSMLQCVFAGQKDVKLIRHARNRGVSAAIQTGLQEAREIACSIDCDCSYDPLLLKPMLLQMKEGVDLVTASPYHPNGSVLNVPSWRLLLSRASSRLYQLVTGSPIHTFTACMRVYRRSSALEVPLENPGFLGTAELLSRLVISGRQVVEYPATLEVRIFGQSSMKVFRTMCGHLRLLSQLALMQMGGRNKPAKAAVPQSLGAQPTPRPSGIASEVEL